MYWFVVVAGVDVPSYFLAVQSQGKQAAVAHLPRGESLLLQITYKLGVTDGKGLSCGLHKGFLVLQNPGNVFLRFASVLGNIRFEEFVEQGQPALDDFLCFAVEPVVSGQERLQALKFFFQQLVLPAVVFLSCSARRFCIRLMRRR